MRWLNRARYRFVSRVDCGAFSVIGYNFGGQYKEYRSPLAALPCKGNTRCVAGYFVQHVIHGGGPGDLGGTDKGANRDQVDRMREEITMEALA